MGEEGEGGRMRVDASRGGWRFQKERSAYGGQFFQSPFAKSWIRLRCRLTSWAIIIIVIGYHSSLWIKLTEEDNSHNRANNTEQTHADCDW